MEKERNPILVLGANGKTGSRVASKLQDLNIPFRKGSRQAAIKFDWADKSTWAEVLNGISQVYITFQPDLAMDGSIAKISQFVQLAEKSNVNKLVLLSGRGEYEAERCEQIIMESGLKWTIVRASWFSQNFSENYLLEPILAGYVTLPADEVKEPFIDIDDIAEVVIAALTQDKHDGKIYEVTGPELLTFKEAVEKIAKATRRDIPFKYISVPGYAAEMKKYGVPGDIIGLISYLFSEILDGRNESITKGVEEALGRKATTFDEYVKKTVETGVWDVANNK
jgi:uncharacterized protein YbjT (DUF2867 family)